MITHGNKQISEIVYARKSSEGGGAVRLTNIIRGAQVVFGGLYPKVTWLYPTTRAAILAAFGQTDGKAVIKATNAYLNALAETDPTKASALAGFINEDPMLVCSLGLQPQGVVMPIRWLVGDGNQRIDTCLNTTSDIVYEIEVMPKDINEERNIIGNRKSLAIIQLYVNKFRVIATHWTSADNVSVTTNSIYALKWTNKGFWINGELQLSYDRSVNEGHPISIFHTFSGESTFANPFIGGVSYAKILTGDNKQREMYPFIRQGANGMIDTLTGTFYPNANISGSFSIEYTLPDGTQWTPLNQTP